VSSSPPLDALGCETGLGLEEEVGEVGGGGATPTACLMFCTMEGMACLVLDTLALS
jgi:hypothetical protein